LAKLFTFEDLETGDLQSIVAVNEAAARLRLGGIWSDAERTAARASCDIANLPKRLEEALAEEKAAQEAVLAANPVGKVRFASTDALAEFSAAEARYAKLKAHREQLSRIAAGL
jgi:hypothetical protein